MLPHTPPKCSLTIQIKMMPTSVEICSSMPGSIGEYDCLQEWNKSRADVEGWFSSCKIAVMDEMRSLVVLHRRFLYCYIAVWRCLIIWSCTFVFSTQRETWLRTSKTSVQKINYTLIKFKRKYWLLIHCLFDRASFSIS